MAVVVAGCGGGETSNTISTPGDSQYAFDLLGGRMAGFDRVRSFGNLADYLPNTLGDYRDGSAPSRLYPSAAVVLGTITAVSPGRGVVEGPELGPDESDDDRQTDVAFDSPDASWRTMLLTIEVEEFFGEDGSGPSELVAGVTFGGGADPDRFGAGLLGIGRALFVLEHDGGLFFPDRNDVWMLGGDGVLVAPVTEDGQLSWPMVESVAEQQELLDGAATVAEVRSRVADPPRTILVEQFGETWRRVDDST